jgi:hypothetical protein
MELDEETLDNLTDTVKDNDGQFPPDWRLSRRGRAAE